MSQFLSASTEEHTRLECALKCSKDILEYVNQAVKDFENKYTLQQLQRKIDKRQIDSENEELKVNWSSLQVLIECVWKVYFLLCEILWRSICWF